MVLTFFSDTSTSLFVAHGGKPRLEHVGGLWETREAVGEHSNPV
jgi:hypothetical protein